MASGSEFNINKVWDFIESKPFYNKDYYPMFSTAKEIYDKWDKKELEMYTNFQWNGRDTPMHRKELSNLQRIKTMDGASKMKENIMKNLTEQQRKQVKAFVKKLVEGKFYRLPNDIVDDNVYRFKRSVESACDSVLHGNDFEMKQWESILKSAQEIIKSAKEFNSAADLPDEFKGK